MITTKVSLENPGILFLGRRGEKDARQFVFDVNRWAADLLKDKPDSYHYRLLVLRPREKTPYEAEIALSGEGLVWVPQPADFAKPGEGSIEIQFVSNTGAVLKSSLIRTRCEGCIGDSEGPVPEDQPGWYKQVLGAVEDSARAAKSAEQSAGKAAEEAEKAERVCNVFVAEFGKTTWQELKAACDADKCVEVNRAGARYGLYTVTPTHIEFRQPGISNVPFCRCNNNSTWSVGNWGISVTPTAHASRHGKDGSDPITPEMIGATPSFQRGLNAHENMDNYNIPGIFSVARLVAPTVKNAPFERSFAFRFIPGISDNTLGKQEAWVHSQSDPEYAKRVLGSTGWSAWKYD